MIKYIKENNDNIIEIPIEYIEGATLLSKEEYEKYRNNISELDDWWWLRSAGRGDYGAYYVYCDGSVGDFCYNYYVDDSDYGIRPALILDLQSSNLNVGNKFDFGEHMFTIISNDLAICDDFIGESCFRKNWKAKDTNVYEKSDVKKVVDEWFNESYLNKKLRLKSDKEEFNEFDWGF